MYEPFFAFRKRPFPAVSRADQYFPGAAIEAARTILVRCIRRAEGPGLVIGPSGTGKTMLCHVLAEELSDQLRVVLLASGRLGSRRALLQAILYELGQPYRGLDEGEARLALADYITLSDECPNGVLLMVDEAHTLPLRLLDEVRMTTNLAHEGKPWVRVVLAGGCALEERFASPKLDSFNQRIAARCYLESFGAAETRQYIWAQTDLAGGRGESLFTEPACQAAYRATDGVPRLINQVCDQALLLACAAGHRRIDARHIEEAWADLQQLPTPWNGEAAPSSDTGSVVEFGRLDDDTEAFQDEAVATPDTIPVLRISALPDDGAGADIDSQVDHIEQMLGRVDSDDAPFEPAGSIGPEVELRFDEPSDPFGDDFAEEELIDDRPSTLGRAHFPESAVMPAPSRLPAAAAAAPAPVRVDPSSDADRPLPGEPGHGAASAGPVTRLNEPVAQLPDADEPESQLCHSIAALVEETAAVPAQSGASGEAGREASGREAIRHRSAVDEGEGEAFRVEPERAPARRTVAAPRPKYSRLFATLRQG